MKTKSSIKVKIDDINCDTYFRVLDQAICGTGIGFQLNSFIPVPLLGGVFLDNTGTAVSGSVFIFGPDILSPYTYRVTLGNCNYVTDILVTMVSQDVVIRAKLEPVAFAGITPYTVVLTVKELAGVSHCAPHVVNAVSETLAPRGSGLVFNPTQDTYLNSPVNNYEWIYLGVAAGDHVFRYIANGGLFPPSGVSTLVYTAIYDPQGNSGSDTLSSSAQLQGGGEAIMANNGFDVLFNYTP